MRATPLAAWFVQAILLASAAPRNKLKHFARGSSQDHALEISSSSNEFDLVGFAKSNPLGTTTGGEGGSTTTVSSFAALKTAVEVPHCLFKSS